jgi:transcriptional regulator GlxA family with amidase domain
MPLEFVGPLDMFAEANFMLNHSGRHDAGYDVEIVTTEPGAVYERNGMKILVDKPFHALRGPIDTIVISAIDYDEKCLKDERFMSWVGRVAPKTRRIASVCIGAYVLAEAGVLDGRRATTHWSACADFAARYPDVNLDPDPIFVKDDNVYTSAGATAGLDLMLALIEEDFGKDLALRVAQGMVVYLKRPGGQSQFSVQVEAQFAAEDTIRRLQTYIGENVGLDLSVETLAERAGMSPRNFARVFTRQVGTPPGRFVEHSRLERARQLLEQSRLEVGRIAERCGYGTADGMRLAFDRHLGTSPREYRRRFATSKAG